MSTKSNLSTRPSSNPSLSAQTALHHAALDTWINRHFEEEVRFLQALVQVPTDTPPGNNAPHAEQAAALLADFGFAVEKHPVPASEVAAAGLESITNLVVRVPFGAAQGESTRKKGKHCAGTCWENSSFRAGYQKSGRKTRCNTCCSIRYQACCEKSSSCKGIGGKAGGKKSRRHEVAGCKGRSCEDGACEGSGQAGSCCKTGGCTKGSS